jgi:hypothetical protein
MFETIINNGEGEGGPKLSNPNKQFMKVESVADGLSFPTSMEFIDNENILVLEKDHGTAPYFFFEWNIRGQTGA